MNKFDSLFFDFFFTTYSEYYKNPSVPFQLSFQDPVTPVMNGLLDLYDYVFVFLIIIISVVLALLIKVISTFVLNNSEGFDLNFFRQYGAFTSYVNFYSLSLINFIFFALPRMIFYSIAWVFQVISIFIFLRKKTTHKLFFYNNPEEAYNSFFKDVEEYQKTAEKAYGSIKPKNVVSFVVNRMTSFIEELKSFDINLDLKDSIINFFKFDHLEFSKIDSLKNYFFTLYYASSKAALKDDKLVTQNIVDDFKFLVNNLVNVVYTDIIYKGKTESFSVRNVTRDFFYNDHNFKNIVELEEDLFYSHFSYIKNLLSKNEDNIFFVNDFDFQKHYKIMEYYQTSRLTNVELFRNPNVEILINMSEEKQASLYYFDKSYYNLNDLSVKPNFKYRNRPNYGNLPRVFFYNYLLFTFFTHFWLHSGSSKYYQRLKFLKDYLKLLIEVKLVNWLFSDGLFSDILLKNKSFIFSNIKKFKKIKDKSAVIEQYNKNVFSNLNKFFKENENKGFIEKTVFTQLGDFYLNNCLSSSFLKLHTSLRIGHFNHSTRLEIIWTLIPIILIGLIITPSFFLMYAIDEDIESLLTVKVIGHQWYWSYTYEFPVVVDFYSLNDSNSQFIDKESNIVKSHELLELSLADVGNIYFKRFNLSFDSYMLDEVVDGSPRLLATDKVLMLPTHSHINCIVTADDVIHSWALPSLGVKIDAVPGRLNRVDLFIEHEGAFFGQCSELCGVNHSFMPIHIVAVPLSTFIENFLSL